MQGNNLQESFYGKYRGTVSSNVPDPYGTGRIQVDIENLGIKGEWAYPCVPYAGKKVGFFAIPAKDTHVWVEFEEGNLKHPIWTGCFWLKGEAPEPTAGLQQVAAKILKSKTAMLKLNDLPSDTGFTLEANSLGKIEANSKGLTISWGANSIKLSTDGVSINNNNLIVLP